MRKTNNDYIDGVKCRFANGNFRFQKISKQIKLRLFFI